MKSIKALLMKVLGHRNYLRLIGRLFFVYYKNGWLKNNPSYYSHHFVKNLVQPGNTVIDIGGNLGYFTRIFAQLAGNTGKVYTVEPIALYRELLAENIKGITNVTVLPYALGEAEGIIRMGNPSADKHRHGLMRVLKKEEAQQLANGEMYEVEMKEPLKLFASLGKIDYIKCDIEGYEVPVIPLMKPLIETQQPLLQIETEGENKTIILNMMWSLGYKSFYADQIKLVPVTTASQPVTGDLIFIPAAKLLAYQSLFR